MDTGDQLIIREGTLTILAVFSHGNEIDKQTLVKLRKISGLALETWNRPIEISRSETTTILKSAGREIACHTDIFTDIFIAGVTLLRIEVKINENISLNELVETLHNNKVFIEDTELSAYIQYRTDALRKEINPAFKEPFYKNIKRFYLLKLKDFSPRIDQKELKSRFGETITRFLSGETSVRPLHKKEIDDIISHDISYYDEDLYIVSTEGVFILGCDDYLTELRELTELTLCLFVLFHTYDWKIDREIASAFDAIKQLNRSRYVFLTQAPSKLERALLRVSEVGLIILDDIEDLMNPHKITTDWYYKSAYIRMLQILDVRVFEKVVENKITALHDLYSIAREISMGQIAIILEIVVIVLIVYEIIGAAL